MKIRIGMACVQPIVRYGLEKLFSDTDKFEIVSVSSNLEDSLILAKSNIVDIVLFDTDNLKIDNVELARKFKADTRNAKVLFFTTDDNVEQLMWMLEYGIEGFLLKSSELKYIIKALDSLAENGSFIQPSLIPLLNKTLLEKSKQRDTAKSLTRRELEVLKLVALGCFNKEVADKLNISERTVKNHVSNIFKKIKVSDRTQAAVFAIKNGIINI